MGAIRAIDYTHEQIVRGKFIFTPQGQSAGRNLGNMKAEFGQNREVTDIRSNEDPLRRRLAQIVVGQTADLKLTLMSQISIVAALIHMSPVGLTRTQALDAEVTKTYVGMKDGDVVKLFDENGLRVFGITPTSCTPANAVRWDEAAGIAEIIGDQANVELVYSIPVVTPADKKAFYQFMSQGQIFGSGMLRQHNALGRNRVYEWPSMSLSLSGNVTMIGDGNDVVGAEITAAINYDPNQPDGLQMGSVYEL